MDILDEFRHHQCTHASEIGWSALTNGELVKQANDRFDLLVTVDKRMPYQTRLDGLALSVVVLNVRSNLRESVAEAVNATLESLEECRSGEYRWVPSEP